GEDDAVRTCAVVERELEQLLALGHRDAFFHLDRAEVRLTERLEVHLLFEQRLDDHLREVEGGGGGGVGSGGVGGRFRSALPPAIRSFVPHVRDRTVQWTVRRHTSRPSGRVLLVPHVREQQHIPDG